MKNRKKLSLILVFVLITALFSATFMSSFAVTQEEYDKAQEEAKAAKEATEAKRKEAKDLAKKAAAAVANFEEAEKQLETRGLADFTVFFYFSFGFASNDTTNADKTETVIPTAHADNGPFKMPSQPSC